MADVIGRTQSSKREQYDTHSMDRAAALDDAEAREPVPAEPKPDELSVKLSSGFYATNWRFSFPRPHDRNEVDRVDVDRYYPDIKVAVDLGLSDEREAARKAALCKLNGIRYGNLKVGMSWQKFIESVLR